MTPRAGPSQEESRPERFSREHVTSVTFDAKFLEQYDRFRDARPELCLGSRPNGFAWAMRQAWMHHGWDPVLGNVAPVRRGKRLPNANSDWRNPLRRSREERTVSLEVRFLEQYDRFQKARPELSLVNRPDGFEWAMRQAWAHYGWDPELGDVAATPMGRLPETEGEWRNPFKKKR